MEKEEHQKRKLVDKFKRLYVHTQGGIFTKATRNRILTGEGIAGRGRTRDQFWYRHRENVKTALIDLHLFTEVAGKDNVNMVVTAEALKPTFDALLWHPVVDNEPPDRKRAGIARLLIREGFSYLRSMKSDHVTLSHKQTIEQALDLADYLVGHFPPEREGDR